MTEQTEVAISEYEENGLGVYGARKEVRELGQRIKTVLPGGKKLNELEALALAQYGYASDLDPLRHECYWMPGAGPVPGIMGYRRKADEQLEHESKQSKLQVVPRWWCEFVPAEPGVDAEFEPEKGDIAYRCILRDSLTRGDWEQRRLSSYIQLMTAKDPEAWEHAEKIVGREPTWEAVGVVYGSEKFGTPEKMDRHERAQKRAEKPAIKKRFPRIRLQEPVGAVILDDYSDAIDVEVEDVTGEPVTAEQILDELGYTQFEKEPEPPLIVTNTSEKIADLPDNPKQEPVKARSWDGALVQALVREGLAAHPKHGVGMLNLSNLPGDSTEEQVIAWCRTYRGQRDADVSTADAVKLANGS